MSDLRDLYQEVIFDHNRRPRNYGRLEDANRFARGDNPLCGDKLTLYVRLEDGVIKDLRFEGSGCAISTASASLMTERLKGASIAEAEAVFHQVHDMVTKPNGAAQGDAAGLGKLGVLAGVCAYPSRVKCATLAWHTLQAALADRGETATTE